MNIVKKIFNSVLISIALISSSYADNFYAGVGAGYMSANFDKHLTIDSTDKNYSYYKTDEQPGTGASGNIFIGYMWKIDRVRLAAELNDYLSSLKYHGYFSETKNGINNTSEAEYTMHNGYGVSLLAGYEMINNVVLYGRAGYVRSGFKYWEYKTDKADRSGVTENTDLNGVRYGLGISTTLTKNAGLRLEFNQTKYQTFTNTTTGPTFLLPAGQTRQIEITPTVNQIELDFVYNFS